MYAPVIQSATAKKRYKCGPYEAVLLDQIVAEGSIGYEFIIVVFKEGATDPFLFVTSERNDPDAGAELFREMEIEPEMDPVDKGKSHFLCLFDEQGHFNLGDSDDWGDVEKFEAVALKILADRLGETPVVI
jgi:hypothetical protein